MNPLVLSVWVLAGVCLTVWVTSLATREHSWVDRIWSIIPIRLRWRLRGAADFDDVRLNVMLVLVMLWGARLTFNFARKGGYAPRRRGLPLAGAPRTDAAWQFQLFNLFFIALYQNVLLLLITLPAYTAFSTAAASALLDVVAAAVFLGFLVGETVADQQQWKFQRGRGRRSRPVATRSRGFLQTGLFRYSRHPNFFFEQAQWWVIFVFGAIAAGSVAAVDGRRRGPSHAALRRLDPVHREHLAVAIPGVRRLPGQHVGRYPVVPEGRPGQGHQASLTPVSSDGTEPHRLTYDCVTHTLG